jgi:hypothetical protein
MRSNSFTVLVGNGDMEVRAVPGKHAGEGNDFEMAAERGWVRLVGEPKFRGGEAPHAGQDAGGFDGVFKCDPF